MVKCLCPENKTAFLESLACYRPQRKVMFSEASVSHSVKGGRIDPPTQPLLDADPPPDADSPRRRSPSPVQTPGSRPPRGRPATPVVTSSGGHCSSRCASYWNAFLLPDMSILSLMVFMHTTKIVGSRF